MEINDSERGTLTEYSSPSINVKVLRAQLDRLSSVKDVPIAQLNEGLLEDFTAISHNITTLLGSDGYNLLFKEIQQKFPNSDPVQPGTVAGYFMGCFVPSNFKYGKNCSLACLTGAPQFYDTVDSETCKKNVYIAPYDGEYKLTKMTTGSEDVNTAIVYIQPPFQGFSREEIKQLKSEGIDQVIFSYYDNNDYYTSEPFALGKINVRSTNKGVRKASYGYGSDSSSCGTNKWIHIILLVVLILVAIYALWYSRNN